MSVSSSSSSSSYSSSSLSSTSSGTSLSTSSISLTSLSSTSSATYSSSSGTSLSSTGAFDDFVAQYIFEDDMQDQSGNGHHATPSNVTYSNANGIEGQGKYGIFNGTTSYG